MPRRVLLVLALFVASPALAKEPAPSQDFVSPTPPR